MRVEMLKNWGESKKGDIASYADSFCKSDLIPFGFARKYIEPEQHNTVPEAKAISRPRRDKALRGPVKSK